jgi:hypothetical protein
MASLHMPAPSDAPGSPAQYSGAEGPTPGWPSPQRPSPRSSLMRQHVPTRPRSHSVRNVRTTRSDHSTPSSQGQGNTSRHAGRQAPQRSAPGKRHRGPGAQAALLSECWLSQTHCNADVKKTHPGRRRGGPGAWATPPAQRPGPRRRAGRPPSPGTGSGPWAPAAPRPAPGSASRTRPAPARRIGADVAAMAWRTVQDALPLLPCPDYASPAGRSLPERLQQCLDMPRRNGAAAKSGSHTTPDSTGWEVRGAETRVLRDAPGGRRAPQGRWRRRRRTLAAAGRRVPPSARARERPRAPPACTGCTVPPASSGRTAESGE